MNELRMKFEETKPYFLDRSGRKPLVNKPWAPVLMSKESIDEEIHRLADLQRPIDGRRQSLFVHPGSSSKSPSLAPGIQVSLNVLKPGEKTAPFRHNATEVNFCIQGGGNVHVGGRDISFNKYDVWNTPSYTPYWRENNSDELQVCLTYSNAPLLQFMEVYMEDDTRSSETEELIEENDVDNPRRKSPYGSFELSDGAWLMPYEELINPACVESNPLFWPWAKVEAELKKLEDLGADYVGRRLYLLYNPVTGRTNGTTPNFFATITIRPPNIVDRPHRHVSASINYYFHGSGYSTVAGNRYEWKAGDLMLSAPGWAVHNHASYDEKVYELTIQDQPLTLAMEALLWQENLKQSPALLGAQMGFDTNRK